MLRCHVIEKSAGGIHEGKVEIGSASEIQEVEVRLILIFKYKNYVDNCFTKLIPHEIALWCCKIGILEICWKTPVSLFVSYERCGLVITVLKFSGCSA
jgi:hypothetical protein